ncbi:MAG: beta-galactosidase, partial [Abitibacteriaceae bacterium]|nr:beta-galactosidase [Abditibacteriaceae bacterium]
MMIKYLVKWLTPLVILLSSLETSSLALIVRVDATRGAPRLLVNNQPVRARMFFGIQQSAPLMVVPGREQTSFDFTANESEPATATMHFRFGQTAGEVYLDNIRVTDLTTQQDVIPLCNFEDGPNSFTRDWTYWPQGEQNTVGKIQVEPGVGEGGSAGLHISLKAPANGQWPDFHIYHQPHLALTQGHRYRVSFWLRVDHPREVHVAFYRPGANFVFLGGPPGYFESQIKLAASAGVNFVSFPIGLPWPAPGQPVDWAEVDNICATVLAANPQALLLPRIPMDPPGWWQQAHPDEIMRWEDEAGKAHRKVAVVSSALYRHDAGERLAALVTHLEAKFGEHVAGYHPSGQNTGEWFYEDTWGNALSGYAPADQAAWRQWLRVRYATDAALQTAWQDAAATFATATVPAPALRHAAPAGVLRDPTRERALTDFAEFQQERMADCVCDFARVVRQASQGRKLVVFFYGYVFEFGAVHTGASTAGHYGLRRVLNSPDIDVLCSPISYFDRGLDGGAPSMTAAESVALAGKMWLNEDDTATYLSSGDAPGWTEKVTTLADTNAELVRNVGQEAIRNFGTWWMDLGSSGWFNDPGMWDALARLKALDEPLLQQPTPYHPEVAAVLDLRSMCHVAEGGEIVTRPAVYEARKPLGRTGAPYGQYLLDDVIARRVQSKLYVFLNAWCLSAAQRAGILQATRGSTRIWCY